MPSTDIYTLSLHDAFRSQEFVLSPLAEEGCLRAVQLPSTQCLERHQGCHLHRRRGTETGGDRHVTLDHPLHAGELQPFALKLLDRKSTRLNSSHRTISYAVHRHLHSFPTRRFPISGIRAQPAGRGGLPSRRPAPIHPVSGTPSGLPPPSPPRN